MKQHKLILPILVIGLLAPALFSCDSDDDNYIYDDETTIPGIGGLANPANTFSTYMPELYADGKVAYNSADQVASITYKNKVVTFDYAYLPKSRATGSPDKVAMIVTESGQLPEVYLFNLNSKGFATSCQQTLSSAGGTDFRQWTFGYNEADQLTSVRKGSEKLITATYDDDDIVDLRTDYLYGAFDSTMVHIVYSDPGTAKVPNAAGVMLFDKIYGMGLGDVECAYIAGILGKATASIPFATYSASDPDDLKTFQWVLLSGEPLAVITEDEFLNFGWTVTASTPAE